MAPIDWDMLMKLDVQDLQNEENTAQAEEIYCVLCDVRRSHQSVL